MSFRPLRLLFALLLPLALAPGLLLPLVAPTAVSAQGAATLTVTPSDPIPGTMLHMSGSHFTPGRAVTVVAHFKLLNGTSKTETATTTANGSGSFSQLPLHVPVDATGNQHVLLVAHSVQGAAVAANLIYVRPLAPRIALSPNPAEPGQSVVVSGSGWAAGETVTIRIQSVGALTVTTNASGALSKTVTLSAHAAPGSFAVTASDSSGRHASTTLKVVPATPAPLLSAGPQPALPGQTVSVYGSHFTPGQTVAITGYFKATNGGTITVVGSARASSSGHVGPVAMRIPPGAMSGVTDTIVAKPAGTHTSATTSIQLDKLYTVVAVSPSSARPGSVVNVVGGGFAVNESVTVRVDGGQVATATTDSDGTFSTSFTVSSSAHADTATVTAADAYGRSANATLQITRSQPHAQAASLTVGPQPAYPGTDESVTGAHFPANSHVTITANFKLRNGDIRPVTVSGQTDATGRLGPLALPVPPETASGSQASVVASTTANPKAATTTIQIATLHTAISISPNPTRAGTRVTVAGQGFAAHISVTIRLDAATVATATTSGSGTFTATFTLNSTIRNGNYTVTATGADGRTSSVTLRVATVQPVLSVGPQPAIPGATVSAYGTRFQPNVTVTVTANFVMGNRTTRPVSVTARTDANGNFGPVAIRIPPAAAAGHVDTVAATVSGRSRTSTQLHIAPLHPSIALSPNEGRAGAQIQVTGSQFAANDRISVFFEGHQVATATTDGTGSFVAHFVIPGGTAATTHNVRAQDTAGRAANAALKVEATPPKYQPSIQIYPTTTIPGAHIFVTGAGFPANSTVTISGTFTLINGQRQTVQSKATSSAKGIFFNAILTVPGNAASATVPITATANGYSAASSLVVQRPKASIVLSPTTATPGERVTVQGFGFAANTGITITFNGGVVASAHTDASGRFTAAFTLPQGLATGTYPVAAAGAGGNSATAQLQLRRQIVTTYYFAEGNTSYDYGLYLAVLNPGNIQGRMTVTYFNNQGQTIVKSYTLPAHSRKTLDVRQEVGANRGVAMKVTADVPIAAERVIYHGADGAMSPGATGLNTHWYFSEGNTLHGYSEWIPMLNPNNAPAQVHMLLLTTHHGSRAINFTLGAHTRISLHVNQYVAPDAVGVAITSSQPIVAERTVYYNTGGAIFITNKVGMNTYGSQWYFPAGQTYGGAIEWISAANPASTPAHLTMSIYSAKGDLLATVHRTVPANGRKGYKLDQITPNADISVIVKSDRPVLSERLLYTGQHNALTDNFGVENPGTAWWFANGDTRQAEGYHDTFAVFNPNLGPAPVIVRVMTWSGKVINVPYLIAPTTKQVINLDTVVPNSQFGVVVNSTVPITVEHFITFNNGRGGMTTHGIRGY